MWGGFYSPFDDIAFRTRSWVDSSGWPIKGHELEKFYKKATNLVELESENFDTDFWIQKNHLFKSIPFNRNVIYDKMWQFSPPTRFGEKYKKRIVNSDNIFLYNYANVTEVISNYALSEIKSVSICNINGKKKM